MVSRFEEQQLSEFFDGVYDTIIASRTSNVYDEHDDGFQELGRTPNSAIALETPRTSLAEASEWE
jgi:hypothetical protein